MKKYIILSLISVFLIEMLGAQSTDSQLSPAHVVLKGTKYAIIPPTNDYKVVMTPYYGLENRKNGAKITIASLDLEKGEGDRIKTIQKSLMEEGKSFIAEKEILISGIPASLKKVRGFYKLVGAEGFGQLIDCYIYQLLFDYKTERIVIHAFYPVQNVDSEGKNVEHSIETFVFLKDKVIVPIEQVLFSLDYTTSKMSPTITLPNLLELSDLSEGDGDVPRYTITRFDFSQELATAIGDGNIILNDELSSPIISDKKLSYFENPTYKGLEVTAIENEVNGNKRLLYTCILRNESKIFRIKGETIKEHQKYLDIFRKLSESVKEND